MSKTAIITGITGQDGAYLAKFLIAKGYKVVGLARDVSKGNSISLDFLGIRDQIKLHSVDLCSFKDLMNLFGKYNPDEVYNLAAQSSVGKSFSTPYETISFNTQSSLALLEIVRTDKSIKLYQASSSEMFGKVKEELLPIKETDSFHPLSPYATSKASTHWFSVNYREAYNIFSCCGILFNHESCLRKENFVTKKIINTAIRISRGEGITLNLGNCNIFRDWGYAPKYVEAMWLMLQQKKASDYLICSGEAYSLNEFVSLVFEYLAIEKEKYVRIDPKLFRPTDLEIIYGSNKLAKTNLGWEYNLSFKQLIEKLIEDEIEWMNFQSRSL